MKEPSNKFTDRLPDDLPDADALIKELRAASGPDEQRAILDRYPSLELLAPVDVLAKWLGMKEQSVYMARTRKRADGTPVWPEWDDLAFGLMMWKFSTIALSRASAPGRGWNLRSEARESA